MIAMITDEQVKQNIAANVARLRGERSRYALAKEVRTTTGLITRIEQGHYMPGAGMLTRLAAALGVLTDDIVSAPPVPRKKTSRR